MASIGSVQKKFVKIKVWVVMVWKVTDSEKRGLVVAGDNGNVVKKRKMYIVYYG